MNSIDYKRLRHSSKLLDLKEHKAQSTFYGNLFTDFPLSFQIDNIVLEAFEKGPPKVKEQPLHQIKELKPPVTGPNEIASKTVEKAEEIAPVESGPL
ncbi:MAG: hypothetical protein VXY34_00740, partial [Bdellovibrionota bacterium]|nr:hypothetical protein [Bdellovibrionota bacterium]